MGQVRSIACISLNVEVTYSDSSGEHIYRAFLDGEKNRSRLVRYMSFDPENPPEFLALDDGDFIRTSQVSRLKIKRNMGDNEPDQHLEYAL